MHDHLRDMGREIAASQSPHRFWLPDMILNLKKHSQGRMLIRGIKATMNHIFGLREVGSQNCLEQFVRNSRRGFKRCKSSFGLEILHVESTQLTEELAAMSEDLVWLRWNSRQHQRLPSWLSLRNLRVLELYTYPDSVYLWEDNVDPPLQLRGLRIGKLGLLFPTSIGRLKQLKKITIKSFGGSSLPEEFCGLQSLELLELKESQSLYSLPAGLGDLKNLWHVNLSYCSQLKMLPDSFKQRIHLDYLNLLGCGMLSSLPACFGDLINLQHIDLSYCKQLIVLPVSFKQLVHLEYLNLQGCGKLKLRLDKLENITKLQYLNLGDCQEVEEMPRQIRNQASLKALDLSGCWKLKELPTDIGQLCKLETLRIGCPLLTSFPSSVGNLFSLTSLYIEGCGKLEYLPHSIGGLNTLQHLCISSSGVKELPFGAASSSCCHNLQTLHLSSNHQLREIQTLPTSVNRIDICDCSMLKNISGIGGLVNLRDLTIFYCLELDELPSFGNLAALKEFRIYGCPKVEKIEGLENLRSLQSLVALTWWEVAGIQSLESVERLRRLELTCGTISALKPCIQSLKECPLEMWISGRAVRFVEPIAISLEFPHLTVMELDKESDVKEILEKRDNASSFLRYRVEEKEKNDKGGEMVRIAVFRQAASMSAQQFLYDKCKSMKTRVMRGEEGRVVEAFYQLFALLE